MGLPARADDLRGSQPEDVQGAARLAKYRGINRGVVVACEGGYYAGDTPAGAVFDTKGRKIKDFDFKQTAQKLKRHTPPISSPQCGAANRRTSTRTPE